MPRFEKPRLLSDSEVNMLRGKALVGAMTPQDQMALCGHVTELEMHLDEADDSDTFGTEGWRHHFGVPE
jgi:hypothetical protein